MPPYQERSQVEMGNLSSKLRTPSEPFHGSLHRWPCWTLIAQSFDGKSGIEPLCMVSFHLQNASITLSLMAHSLSFHRPSCPDQVACGLQPDRLRQAQVENFLAPSADAL